MNSTVVVEVALKSVGRDPPPAPGALRFDYALDAGASSKNVAVESNGDLYVGNADGKITTLVFVLDPESAKLLTWGKDSYQATLAPAPNGPQGAEHVIHISRILGKSPERPWQSSDRTFRDFGFPRDPQNPARDAVQVTFNRNATGQLDFQYSLAVSLKNTATGAVQSVRDDPQIRDRGVPSAPSVYLYLAAAGAIILGGALLFRWARSLFSK